MAEILLSLERIETISADAICNSIGRNMLPGGGVDQSIHRQAGSRLLKVCKELNSCEPGDAKITQAFCLPSNMAIHTNCPKWRGGNYNEFKSLENCYTNSILLADSYGARSLVVPAIGCGVRGFPHPDTAEKTVVFIRNALKSCKHIRKIILSIIDANLYDLFNNYLAIYGHEVNTSEFWNDSWLELTLKSPEYWVSVIGMLHHHWATIQKSENGYEIIFINQHGVIFDRVFKSQKNKYVKYLKDHNFEKWGPGHYKTNFIPFLDSQPHEITGNKMLGYYK